MSPLWRVKDLLIVHLHGCCLCSCQIISTVANWSYLMDEVPDVSGVRGRRPQWVLVVVVQGPLVQTSDAHLDALWLQSVGLLQLTQVIVLKWTQSIHSFHQLHRLLFIHPINTMQKVQESLIINVELTNVNTAHFRCKHFFAAAIMQMSSLWDQ